MHDEGQMRPFDGSVATISSNGTNSSNGTRADEVDHESTSLVPSSDLFLSPETPPDESFVFEEFSSPFADGFASSESEFESSVFENLVAELEDDEFEEAVQRLVDDGAARHLGSISTWGSSSEAPTLADDVAEQWMSTLLAHTDRMLDDIGREHDGQSLEAFGDTEFEFTGEHMPGGLDAQEFFFGSLKRKLKKAVKAAKGLIKKGIKFVGKLNPLNRVIAALKKAVRPLLRRILRRVIGRLPRSIRPAAHKLARRLGISSEAVEELSEAERFDAELAELLLSDDEGSADVDDEFEADPDRDSEGEVRAAESLDGARARLARQLAELPDGSSPIAEMEQFIPAVLAAKPLIKLGITIVGRKRVVNMLAKVMATLMARIVGRNAARTLSRHLADSGLKALGFEAELEAGAELIGTEALVAAAEETISSIGELDEEWLADDQLLEAEVREVFAAAAARHLPASVMRSDLVDSSADGERGVWIMMPRTTSPIYRYKKYSRRFPLQVTRPLARSVLMTNGETLERRLNDAGVEEWPVSAELDVFELLPGGEVGHLAAYETMDGSADESEFDELTAESAAILTGDSELGAGASAARRVRRRMFRLRVPGRRVRKRSPFSVRLDLSSTRPDLRLHVRLTERDAHRIAVLAERRQTMHIVSALRGVFDKGIERALQQRLDTMARRRKVAIGGDMAGRMVVGALRSISQQLPGAAGQLASAAQAPAAGMTLSFTFSFPDKAALASGAPDTPSLRVRPGMHHE